MTPELYRQLGMQFVRARVDKDMTREDLVKTTGVKHSVVAAVEEGRGGTVSLEHLVKLAAAVDLTVGVHFKK